MSTRAHYCCLTMKRIIMCRNESKTTQFACAFLSPIFIPRSIHFHLYILVSVSKGLSLDVSRMLCCRHLAALLPYGRINHKQGSGNSRCLKIREKNYFLHRHHLGRWLLFAAIEPLRRMILSLDFHEVRV